MATLHIVPVGLSILTNSEYCKNSDKDPGVAISALVGKLFGSQNIEPGERTVVNGWSSACAKVKDGGVEDSQEAKALFEFKSLECLGASEEPRALSAEIASLIVAGAVSDNMPLSLSANDDQVLFLASDNSQGQFAAMLNASRLGGPFLFWNSLDKIEWDESICIPFSQNEGLGFRAHVLVVEGLDATNSQGFYAAMGRIVGALSKIIWRPNREPEQNWFNSDNWHFHLCGGYKSAIPSFQLTAATFAAIRKGNVDASILFEGAGAAIAVPVLQGIVGKNLINAESDLDEFNTHGDLLYGDFLKSLRNSAVKQ